jgi:tetratricopeptide (TPR) repeat protein
MSNSPDFLAGHAFRICANGPNPMQRLRILALKTLGFLALACCLGGCGQKEGSDPSSAWRVPLHAADNAAGKSQLDAAARHYRAAIAAFEQSPDRDELSRGGDYARAVRGLARTHASRGEIAKAEDLYRDLLKIQTPSLDRAGTSGRPVAMTLASLAELSLARQDYESSEVLFLRILSMQTEGRVALEPDDWLLAYAYGGLGKTYAALGDSARADSLAALSMSLRLYSQAFDLYLHEAFEEAEPAFRRALDFQTKHLGRDSPHVARTLHRLGWLLQIQQRPDEALTLYRDAADILALGDDILDRADVLEDIAALLRTSGEAGAADSASSAAAAVRAGAGEG